MDTLPFAEAELERSLPERFARVVAAAPAAVAITGASERVSYAELDRRSDRLGAAVLHLGAADPSPVAIALADPARAITALLAIWKAGRLALPLDLTHPGARLAAILDDAEAGMVISDRASAEAIAGAAPAIRRLWLDNLGDGASGEPPRPAIAPEALACLLYTSGSSGAPKGVVRSHRNVLHRARCSAISLGIGPADRVSALHSLAFGAGLRDVLAALLSGAAVLPFDLRREGPGALARWIGRERPTVLCAVATTFRHVLGSLDPAASLASIRIVRLGSEPLYRQDVERFRARFPAGCVLVAGYGASEASGIVELRLEPGAPLPAGRVPAGYPHHGVEILVLDEDGRPVAPGEAGEIAVRSRFLSDGYWRQPALTRATFRPDAADPALRVYRTGDVGRQASDGCLEVLGRRDDELKVRGYRVQPGEIELALAQHPGLREAAVVGRATAVGDVRLVAYVVAAASAPAPPAAALRRFLRERLPAYMVPGTFVALDALPVNANGKVDRTALPPAPEGAELGAGFEAPRSPLEHQIAEIWERLLRVGPVGARDDFFDLGGDSLLASAFAAAVEEVCGTRCAPSLLLEAPTVAEVAMALDREACAPDRPLRVVRGSGARAPLFFHHGDFNGAGLYCHRLARCLDDSQPFYALHPHGLDGRGMPPTIEAMAAALLPALRAARPSGPYRLGGLCNGGLVALEMARQLVAGGEPVELVVLVDARAPRPGLRALHRAAELAGRLGGLPPTRRRELFAALECELETLTLGARYHAARLLRAATAGRRPRAGALAKLTGARQRAASARRAAPLPTATESLRPGDWRPVTTPDERRFGYHRAIRRYLPAPYEGPVVLFRAQDVPARRADLGWGPLLPGLRTLDVPGDHHTCVTRHVDVLGAELERVLRQDWRRDRKDGR